MLLPSSLVERFKTPDQIYELKITIKTNQYHTFLFNLFYFIYVFNFIYNSRLKWKQDMSTSLRRSNWFQTRMSEGITHKMLSQFVAFTSKVQPKRNSYQLATTNQLWSLNLHWKSADWQTFWSIFLSSCRQEIQSYTCTKAQSIFFFDFGIILKPKPKWHTANKLDFVLAQKYSYNEHVTIEISSGMSVLQADFECKIRVNKWANKWPLLTSWMSRKISLYAF